MHDIIHASHKGLWKRRVSLVITAPRRYVKLQIAYIPLGSIYAFKMQFNKNSCGGIELRDDRALVPFSHVYTHAKRAYPGHNFASTLINVTSNWQPKLAAETRASVRGGIKNQLGVECIMDADKTPYTYSPRLRSLRFPRETGYLAHLLPSEQPLRLFREEVRKF